MRRTKIIATLGPVTSSPEILGQLIDAGMNIARLNMSHAPHDWVRATVQHLRAAAQARKRSIGILMDTQGPAIRTGACATAPTTAGKPNQCNGKQTSRCSPA